MTCISVNSSRRANDTECHVRSRSASASLRSVYSSDVLALSNASALTTARKRHRPSPVTLTLLNPFRRNLSCKITGRSNLTFRRHLMILDMRFFLTSPSPAVFLGRFWKRSHLQMNRKLPSFSIVLCEVARWCVSEGQIRARNTM